MKDTEKVMNAMEDVKKQVKLMSLCQIVDLPNANFTESIIRLEQMVQELKVKNNKITNLQNMFRKMIDKL